ncbi:MAG: acyl-CoA dehydrogenase family protein [Chloroflexota bacterium]
MTTGDIHGKLQVPVRTGWISCQDVRVPAANRIGEEGEVQDCHELAWIICRYTVASGTVSFAPVSTLPQIFLLNLGQPIATYQLVQQKLAFMQQWYDTSRLLYLKAGWMKNEGRR